MKWRLTDDEFVSRLRWWSHNRRLAGVCVLGIAFVLLAVISGLWSRVPFEPIKIPAAGGIAPASADVGALIADVNYWLGIHIGFALGQTSTGLLMLTGAGLYLLFGQDRRSDLLLRRWNETASKPKA
jgi:hypothetical protein